jgi:ribonuclease D
VTDADTDSGDEPEAAPDVPVLREPRDGVPEPLTEPDRLSRLVDALGRGRGPVALDAERASGYRYSQRAYLVQLRRAGAGTALIDPIALPDLSAVGAALGDAEWILHAAGQDLPCLAEVG